MGKIEELEKSLDQIREVINKIPKGRVASYGVIGQQINPPMSGFFTGRLMGFAASKSKDDQEVPWWRVLAKDGSISIVKRDPILGQLQVQRLKEEGVQLDKEGRVLDEYFWEFQ